MFIRKKRNKSGVVSVQIISKAKGRYEVVRTVGSSADEQQIELLCKKGHEQMRELTQQERLNFEIEKERVLKELFFNGISEIRLVGPELLLGKLFDEIGFSVIKDKLFRSLVITRLVYPVSKLKTTDYWFKYTGKVIGVHHVYRYLDKLHREQKEIVQQISYAHTLHILNNEISMVFYDVTTLYFEIEDQDDLRKIGYGKDKQNHPQILLGLLVSVDGYPLAYDVFEGNKYEGHTLIPVLKAFSKKFKLERLVVIADAGLLSNDNIRELQSKGYEYILGARIKNENQPMKDKILALQLKNGESAVLEVDKNSRIIISYSEKRAKKDAANRKKGLEKLERNVTGGRLTKKSINNRGYNKYLKLEGETKVTVDYEKYKTDSKWNGLKGYLTNTTLSTDKVIENYKSLWKIEKAFRISKTDLRIRPIYHQLQRRIEAHICIAFCAYKIYKELERKLKEKESPMSPEKAIDILKTIYTITITLPYSKTKESRLYMPNEEQQTLLALFEIS